MPTTQQMGSMAYWVHYQKSILACNRLTILEPEAQEEDDPEDARKRAEALDPSETLLKTITDDTKTRGGAPAWSIRSYGDQSVYGSANPALPDLHYGVVTVRSNVWPGSCTFFNAGSWSQIYCGDGLKFENKTYYPVVPPTLCSDPEERTSQAEPNPTAEALAAKENAEAVQK